MPITPIAGLIAAIVLIAVGIRLFVGQPSGRRIAVGVTAILVGLLIAVPSGPVTILVGRARLPRQPVGLMSFVAIDGGGTSPTGRHRMARPKNLNEAQG